MAPSAYKPEPVFENTGRDAWHSGDRPGGEVLREINLGRALRAPKVAQARLRGRKAQGLPRPKTTAETKLTNRTEESISHTEEYAVRHG